MHRDGKPEIGCFLLFDAVVDKVNYNILLLVCHLGFIPDIKMRQRLWRQKGLLLICFWPLILFPEADLAAATG